MPKRLEFEVLQKVRYINTLTYATNESVPSGAVAGLCKVSGYSVHSAASMAAANDWQTIVERNLMSMTLDESDYYWPADTLFEYYQLMETLQENLHERHELLQMLTQAALSLNDT